MAVLPIHLSHSHNGMSVSEKLTFGTKVVTKQTDNIVTFGSTGITPASIAAENLNLKTKNDIYELNPLMHGGLVIAERRWVKFYNKLNKALDIICDGNVETMDLTGFDKTDGESVPTAKPAMPIIQDSSPEGKGGYYVHVKPQPGSSFLYLFCLLDAVVTISGNQINVSKGPFYLWSDTHPTAEMHNMASGDMKLIVIAQNRAGLSDPTPPTTVSIP